LSRLENVRKKDRLVYEKTASEKEPHNFNWLKIIIILGCITALAYFLFFSGLFNIKTVIVEGYSYPEMIKDEIGESTNNSLFKKNIFLFRTRKLEEAFYGDSSIAEIKIKKIYPSKIKVIIVESKPALIWNTAGEKFLIDDRGEVLDFARDEKLTSVTDGSNIKVERGKRVASPTFVKFITTIGADFEAAAGTKINNILIYDILSDVHILTSDGWTVYLDTSKDPTAQLKNLSMVLEEVRKQGKKIQYIDLRLDTKAYYK